MRGDADSLSASWIHGGLGGASVKDGEDQTKGWFRVRYTEKGSEPVLMRCQGDPFEVGNFARARLFPEIEIPQFDEKFQRVMAAR